MNWLTRSALDSRRKGIGSAATGLCGAVLFALAYGPCAAQGVDPFASNNGQIPSKSEYDGPLFSLSHDYPDQVAPVTGPFPWQRTIGNGRITTENANTYTNALKEYVSASMRELFTPNPSWNAAQSGWYNEPWLASQRESIHGLYVGSSSMPMEPFFLDSDRQH